MTASKPMTGGSARTTTRCGRNLMAGSLHIVAPVPLFSDDPAPDTDPVTESPVRPSVRAAVVPAVRRRRIHRAWIVAAVTFVTMIGAAAFRSVPSVFMGPLHMEFGWSHGTIGS